VLRRLSYNSRRVMFLGWVLLLALFVLLYFLPPYVVLQTAVRPLLDRGLASASLSHMLGIIELVIYTCLLSAHTPLLEYALWLFFGFPDKVEVHNMDVQTSSILRAMFEVLKRTPLRILRLESRAHFQSGQASRKSEKGLISDASLGTSITTTDAMLLPFVTLDGRSIVILTGERIVYLLGGRKHLRKQS
jgi:hypothetical protein